MRLIDADTLIEKLHRMPDTAGKFSFWQLVTTYTPTIDAEPVRHGHWCDNGIKGSILSGCSICGYTCGAYSFNYCPNCGAKMDEEVTT